MSVYWLSAVADGTWDGVLDRFYSVLYSEILIRRQGLKKSSGQEGSRMERLEKVGKGCDDKTTLIPDVSYLHVRANFEMANFELTPR